MLRESTVLHLSVNTSKTHVLCWRVLFCAAQEIATVALVRRAAPQPAVYLALGNNSYQGGGLWKTGLSEKCDCVCAHLRTRSACTACCACRVQKCARRAPHVRRAVLVLCAVMRLRCVSACESFSSPYGRLARSTPPSSKGRPFPR